LSEPTRTKSTKRHEAVKPHPREDFQARPGDNRRPVSAGRGRRRGGSDFRGPDHTAQAPGRHPSEAAAAKVHGSHHLGRPSGWEGSKIDALLDRFDQ